MDKKEKKNFSVGTAAAAAAGGMVAGGAGTAAAESFLQDKEPEQIETPEKEEEGNLEEEQPIIQEEQDIPQKPVSHHNNSSQTGPVNQEHTVVHEESGSSEESFRINDDDHISVDSSSFIDLSDEDGDGMIDMVTADLNNNDTPDFLIDTDGDGTMDTVVLDVNIDEDGNVALDENGDPIVGVIAQDVTVDITDEQGLLNEGNLSFQDGIIYQDDPEIVGIAPLYGALYPEDEPWDPETDPIGDVYGPCPEGIISGAYNGGLEHEPFAPDYGTDTSILDDQFEEI